MQAKPLPTNQRAESSVADPDPGSGAFFTPGSQIRNTGRKNSARGRKLTIETMLANGREEGVAICKESKKDCPSFNSSSKDCIFSTACKISPPPLKKWMSIVQSYLGGRLWAGTRPTAGIHCGFGGRPATTTKQCCRFGSVTRLDPDSICVRESRSREAKMAYRKQNAGSREFKS